MMKHFCHQHHNNMLIMIDNNGIQTIIIKRIRWRNNTTVRIPSRRTFMTTVFIPKNVVRTTITTSRNMKITTATTTRIVTDYIDIIRNSSHRFYYNNTTTNSTTTNAITDSSNALLIGAGSVISSFIFGIVVLYYNYAPMTTTTLSIENSNKNNTSSSAPPQQQHDDDDDQTTIKKYCTFLLSSFFHIITTSLDYNNHNHDNYHDNNHHDNNDNHNNLIPIIENQIEINLMEKLSNKLYMQILIPRHHHNYRKDDNERMISPHNNNNMVPKTLKLITIDLPEIIQYGFKNGTCRIASNYIYLDDIAKSKTITNHNNHNNNNPINKNKKSKEEKEEKISINVEQKSWIQDMYHCYYSNKLDNNNNSDNHNDTLGVEILQVNMERFNPKRLIRTRYSARTSSSNTTTTTNNNTETAVNVDHNNHQSQIDAPWNQYAWIYEMNLRLSGRTEYYGSPMISSTRWDHWLFGHIYQDTLSLRYEKSSNNNQRPWYKSIWSYITNNKNEIKQTHWNHHDDEKNMKRKQYIRTTTANHYENNDITTTPISYDKEYNQHRTKNYVDNLQINKNQSNNKPHAVIANGTTLQHVPHSLKLLQKACYENNIPLFIIYRNNDDDDDEDHGMMMLNEDNDDDDGNNKLSSFLHNYHNKNRNNKNIIFYHNLSNVLLDVKQSIKYQLIYNLQEYIDLTSTSRQSSLSLWWSWLYYLPSNSWMMFQLGRLYGRIENETITTNKQKTEENTNNVDKEEDEVKNEKILIEEI